MEQPEQQDSVMLAVYHIRKGGDPEAAARLWREYFPRMVRMARARLGGRSRGAEEDVALDAFDSFFRAVEAGRFPQLDDKDDLWQVLSHLIRCKAAGRHRHDNSSKRGAGLNGQALPPDSAPGALTSPEPTPEEVAEIADSVRWLLGLLPNDGQLRDVAKWKMEACTNQEIAERLGRKLTTAERKLGEIREIWLKKGLPGGPPAQEGGQASGDPETPDQEGQSGESSGTGS